MRFTVKNRRILWLALLGAVLAITAKLGLRYWNSAPMPFEHGRWVQAREDEDWRVRTKMAKYLVNHKELLGQSRSQILQLLGEPEPYTPMPGEPDWTERRLYYKVREEWDWIDPSREDELLIFLDQNGQSVDATIHVWKRHEN